VLFCSGYTHGSKTSHGAHVDLALDPGLHFVGAEHDQLHPGVKFVTNNLDHFHSYEKESLFGKRPSFFELLPPKLLYFLFISST
jgi:hypothetical protein